MMEQTDENDRRGNFGEEVSWESLSSFLQKSNREWWKKLDLFDFFL